MAKPKKRLSVRVTPKDLVELKRWQKKLQGMQESQLTQILLHYGIRYAPKAVAEMMEETDDTLSD